MSNSAELKQGTLKAKNIISADIMQRLDTALNATMDNLEALFFGEAGGDAIPGMTGNAKTSGAGATYAKGVMENCFISGQDGNKNYPLRKRLTVGDVFKAGSERYDGDEQEHSFKAEIGTSGNFIQRDNIDYLESLANGNDFKLAVISGTEYFEKYGWVSKQTANYGWFQNNIGRFFGK